MALAQREWHQTSSRLRESAAMKSDPTHNQRSAPKKHAKAKPVVNDRSRLRSDVAALARDVEMLEKRLKRASDYATRSALAMRLDWERKRQRWVKAKLARAEKAAEKAKVNGPKKIIERTRLEAAAAQEREEKRVVGGPGGLRSGGAGIVRPGSHPRS